MSLGCVAAGAHAQDWFQFEAGLGESYAPNMGNGVWYENGAQYPHTLDMHSLAGEVGITGDLPIPPLHVLGQTVRFAYHVDAVHLAHIHTDAQVDSSDANYNATTSTCMAPCAPNIRMVGDGSVNGLALTIEPYLQEGKYRFGVEAGPFIFRPTWNLADWTTTGPIVMVHDPLIQVGWVAGVEVSRGPWSIAAQYFYDRTRGDKIPAPWTGTYLLMARYRF